MGAVTMENHEWDLEYFKKEEFSNPDKMDYYFVHRLDQLRKMIGKPIVIHSSYRENDNNTHGRGEAVDCHCIGLNVLDFFLLAEKSNLFTGIGVYPNWNNPGLHLDIRLGSSSRWGCWTPTDPKKKNIYVPLDSKFIETLALEALP